MKISVMVLIFFVILLAAPAKGQHHSAQQKSRQEPLSFSPVLTQLLSDPELKDYKLECSLMTIAPGAVDTIGHRHDCELFGYVIEGSVLIGLDKNAPVEFAQGQMFYEKRNILHSLTKNLNADRPAKVLLLFIIKNGRNSYRRESSE
jgi:mannose-6-phosphate isomerase-like protein (cupin superfamily)